MSALPHYSDSAPVAREVHRSERRALAVLAEHRENRRGHVGAMRHAFYVLAHEAEALGRELSAGAEAALQHPFVTGEGR